MTPERHAELVREALDMAYDPPSEAHSALDALLAERERLREALRSETEAHNEESEFIGYLGKGAEFMEWALARRAEIDALLAEGDPE